MAAYAALVSLMQIIDDIEHHHSPPISLDRQQVESLTQTVTFLQGFLEAYNSPVADGDEADPLEIRIADAAYAAEDVIESHIVDKIQMSRPKETKISRFFNWFGGGKNPKNVSSSGDANHDDEQIKLYHHVQKVIEEMDLIKRVAMETNTEKAVVHVHDQRHRFDSASVASLRSSSSTGKNSSFMVCSDDVLLEIMEKLVRGQPHLQVIPIAGMGGIGKTTLAKTVYSKPLIKEHFDICAWAIISQQYNIKDILCELVLRTLYKKREELSEMSEDDLKKRAKLSERSEEELGLELYQYLFGRRFLIVMDDMWDIDSWNRIQHHFPNNEKGSRVLVTTRLSHLSSQLNNEYSLQMKFLDNVSSWDLFSKTVFGEQSCPPGLEEIGEKIVENCRGLPLSIVVVGGILKNMELTKGCWELIRKNLASEVNLNDDQHCFRLLKKSYNHLPVHLKPCFLYMAVFEEDRAIRVSRLIKLWISEGLIKPMNGKSLETIAKGFLKDLDDRNLILILKSGISGNAEKYCKVHDLLRDLSLNISKRERFYHVIGKCNPQGQRRVVIPRNTSKKKVPEDLQSNPQGINSQRRIVIPRNTSKKKVLEDLQSMPYARSVICENGKIPGCQNFGLLRTLSAYCDHPSRSYVNSHMFESVNLRHLVVTVGSMSSSFLSSVNLAWNLHTLYVSCPHTCNAPVGIWKMSQFRHIEFNDGSLSIPHPPSDGVIMENLQTLLGVKNFNCGEEVVKRIPNIKKLGIKYYDRKGKNNDDYYCLSNIKYLCKLKSLHVFCDSEFRGIASLHKLSFPHSLKSLLLWMKMDFEFEEDMLEKIGSLPLLEKLTLAFGSFRTGKWEVVEGQFPCLKYLNMTFCPGLEHWTAQESSFPRLEHLYLTGLSELKEIPSEIGNISTLQKIDLNFCSKLVIMSMKQIVEEQVELQGELSFHVQVFILEDADVRSLADPKIPNFEVIEAKFTHYYGGYPFAPIPNSV